MAYQAQVEEIPPYSSENTDRDIEIAKLRSDAVRNSIFIGGGIAAISTLLLGVRRQQHLESEAVQERITELRIKAVEQLGSESSAVRIGGLHNLERLGENHKELRQTILDEVCAYLRQPVAIPQVSRISPAVKGREPFEPTEPIAPEADHAEEDSLKQELLVRAVGIEILMRRLKAGPRHWRHSHLNLDGAYISDFRLDNSQLNNASFDRAIFTGITSFTDSEFAGRTSFVHAIFEGQALFNDILIVNDLELNHARFSGYNFAFSTRNQLKYAILNDAKRKGIYRLFYIGDRVFSFKVNWRVTDKIGKAISPGGTTDFSETVFDCDTNFHGSSLTSNLVFERESAIGPMNQHARFSSSKMHSNGWLHSPDPCHPGWLIMVRS